MTDFSDIPDDCLELIVKRLGSHDRNSCSLISRHWLFVEGFSRHHLSIQSKYGELPVLSSYFTRFNAINSLSLKQIGDDDLLRICSYCPKLTSLKLQSCDDLLTAQGMKAFAVKHGKRLKKFHCDGCSFGSEGINALLDHSSSLEELSIKRISGDSHIPVKPGVAASSLRVVCLRKRSSRLDFKPLITHCKNLKALKVSHRFGDGYLDMILEAMQERAHEELVKRSNTDSGGDDDVVSVSTLETLHLLEPFGLTNQRLMSIAKHFKHLKELHICAAGNYYIDDQALTAVALGFPDLEELVLIGFRPTCFSLSMIAANCKNLKRLALYSCPTLGDQELSCIADKFTELRNLIIMSCPITKYGMQIFSVSGCTNLVKLKVINCGKISFEAEDGLNICRPSCSVDFKRKEFFCTKTLRVDAWNSHKFLEPW